MAKALILLSALCLLSVAAVAQNHPCTYKVSGNVYCDPCNLEFQTRLSSPIPGAKVQLQCHNTDNGTLTYTANAVTGLDGSYTLTATGDHEDEICEISTESSPVGHCNVAFKNVDKARVSLTMNAGVQGTDRFANPIGFKTATPVAGCQTVLEELGIEIV